MKPDKTIILGFLILFLILPPLSHGAAESEEDHVCFMRIDKNHDGQMSYEEFIPFYGEDKEKFSLMDEDENGTVSHDEYEAYLYDSET